MTQNKFKELSLEQINGLLLGIKHGFVKSTNYGKIICDYSTCFYLYVQLIKFYGENRKILHRNEYPQLHNGSWGEYVEKIKEYKHNQKGTIGENVLLILLSELENKECNSKIK